MALTKIPSLPPQNFSFLRIYVYMAFFKKIQSFFSGKSQEKSSVPISDRGMLLFSHTGEVIKAENVLKDAGFGVEVQAPPSHLHTGCDMVLVVELMYEVAILDILHKHNNAPLQVLPIAGEGDAALQPVSLFHVHDYGQWLMVRAANMKITVDKETHIIVNISGGGCPDVPYLAHKLLGITLEEAEEPRYIGQTLCCYSLQKAFGEARRLLCG